MSSEYELLCVSFKDPTFLQMFGLNEFNALQYFALSPQFFDKNSINERIVMQTRFNELQASMLDHRNMVGVEFSLAYFSYQPSLFVINKHYRHSPTKTELLGIYYIIEGVIYQAPDLFTVLSNRLLTGLHHIHTAFTDISKEVNYHPSLGYSWRTEDERAAAELEQEEETVGGAEKDSSMRIDDHRHSAESCNDNMTDEAFDDNDDEFGGEDGDVLMGDAEGKRESSRRKRQLDTSISDQAAPTFFASVDPAEVARAVDAIEVVGTGYSSVLDDEKIAGTDAAVTALGTAESQYLAHEFSDMLNRVISKINLTKVALLGGSTADSSLEKKPKPSSGLGRGLTIEELKLAAKARMEAQAKAAAEEAAVAAASAAAASAAAGLHLANSSKKDGGTPVEKFVRKTKKRNSVAGSFSPRPASPFKPGTPALQSGGARRSPMPTSSSASPNLPSSPFNTSAKRRKSTATQSQLQNPKIE